MQTKVATQEREDDFPDNEPPTKKLPPSGKWIVSVDRASKRLEDAIATLESGGNPDAVLADLKAAHELVNGRGTP